MEMSGSQKNIGHGLKKFNEIKSLACCIPATGALCFPLVRV
jgi:hypothetical protein